MKLAIYETTKQQGKKKPKRTSHIISRGVNAAVIQMFLYEGFQGY